MGIIARAQVAARWLKHNYPQMASQIYLANHCKACDELQGDHFVFSPDGPFFPQDQAGVDQLKVITGHGSLMASASTVQSSWMELVGLPESTWRGVRSADGVTPRGLNPFEPRRA
ncbi:hypothetical protein ABFO19_17465 [Xanthomonas citri pv. glycines]|uniref:Uncharacterized protein n=1 Tax=Xanthomonas campestris pv. glycines TaxID=473421 RepID=A0AAX0I5R4_XANCG|nr:MULTISPECIES: hypothetical protein [Xanthomonas]AJZ52506.1 hypothetical protein J167_01118 [Xanthomonas citri pv. citri]ARV24356.1 hypothetical protein A9D66_17570 [Xanthomonas citri pv. glycines str. 12-2]OEY98795.1 hypothetical protein BIY41_06965 [Xanthomonas citri pv. glycines]QTK33742.1 hypothetical protein XcgCFBP2526_17145 [Xanthomonas citri pv. glycines CFBP 2526]QTK38210.1 hypothetical protein XcgCFBP7119R_18170 [Xanthomonas citri pv. glycines]